MTVQDAPVYLAIVQREPPSDILKLNTHLLCMPCLSVLFHNKFISHSHMTALMQFWAYYDNYDSTTEYIIKPSSAINKCL